MLCVGAVTAIHIVLLIKRDFGCFAAFIPQLHTTFSIPTFDITQASAYNPAAQDQLQITVCRVTSAGVGFPGDLPLMPMMLYYVCSSNGSASTASDMLTMFAGHCLCSNIARLFTAVY